MSISSTTNRVSYTGNGSTATYNYTFKIFANTDLLVTVKNSSNVETTLALTTDYTVTGVGSVSGGTIVLVNASQAWLDGSGYLDTGWTLVIRRVRPLKQTTDIRNSGSFYPESHEDAFDHFVMIDQQQQDELDRGVKLPETVTSSAFDPTLPTTIATANKAVVTNSDGDGWTMGPTTSEISNAQTYATNASTSADLAEDWATKTDGQVASTDYSSKAWAIGGTGVTDTASKGAAKEWAIETASTVDGTNYSAKEHAIGTQTRGASGGGSAKDWAIYTGGTVDDTEYSAKYYASQAASSASAAATSAAASQWSDVVYITSGDSPVSVVDADAGTLYAVDASGGAITFNLPAISGLTLSGSWSIGIKKTDSSANAITVNRNGTDTIDGATSKTIDRQFEGASFIPDVGASPDDWTTLTFGEVPISGAIVGTTDTQDLSAKTFTDAITLQEQSSTPSTPASGDKKFYAKNDGKLYTLDDGGTELEVGSGGGAGGINYIDNNDFEADVSGTPSGWAKYDDGASDTPVDGTSGSPSLTFTPAGSPYNLRGDTSGQITKSTADHQGEGVSTDFAIHYQDQYKTLYVKFDYLITNTYANGRWAVFIYDVDNATLLGRVQNDDNGDILDSGASPTSFVGTFQATDSTNYRLIFHYTSNDTDAVILYIDNVFIGPDVVVPASIVTEWQSFAPNGTWSTNTTYEGFKRRVGDTEQVYVRINTSGAPDATALHVDLPNTMDTNKLNGTSDGTKLIGEGHARNSATASYSKLAVEVVDSSTIALQVQNAASTYLVDAGGVSNTLPFTFGASDYVEFWAEYPVSGWSAGAMLSTTETNLSTVKSRYSSDAGQSIPNSSLTIINFEDKNWDTHNCVATGASWKFTSPKTGYYKVQVNILFSSTTTWATTESAELYIYKNGVRYSNLGRTTQFDSSNTYMQIKGSDTVEMNKDDYFDIRVIQDSGAALTLHNDPNFAYITIEELPDFSTFSVWGETELVEANSSTFTNFTSTSWADLESIELSPGEWDISAHVVYKNNGASTLTNSYIGISAYSGTTTTDHVNGKNISGQLCAADTGGEFGLSVPRYTVSPTTTTTYYLKGVHNSGTNKQVIYHVSARRIK